MQEAKSSRKQYIGDAKGILLTALLALIANEIAKFPFFSIMGAMIIAILAGMLWRVFFSLPKGSERGINFVSKKILRLAIILMGARLDLQQIIAAGYKVVAIDVIVIIFTIAVILWIGRLFHLERRLSALVAVGTAVCGAAAIVAVAPLIKADKDETAISVATIAVMGTIGALFYTFIHGFLGIAPYAYGVLTGSTLHEIAHVVAAASVGGTVSGNIAIIVKLTRVALLVPVALAIESLFSPGESKGKRNLRELPIPWFIFGFLAMSLVNTTGVLPVNLVSGIIKTSTFLLAMAMAGLGLGVNFSAFGRIGVKALPVCFLGSTALAALGWVLIKLFGI